MNSKKITNFLFEIASLRRLTRSHRQLIQDVSDNISDHSFRVAIIGMLLAELEGCDENKVLKMCLFHDLEEARTGDANYINKIYIERKKNDVHQDQLQDLPVGGKVLKLLQEYYERQTTESKVAKDADLLDQMVLQREYFLKDKVNHKIWQDYAEKGLVTESAKKLAKEIRSANPFEWLYTLAEEKNNEKLNYGSE